MVHYVGAAKIRSATRVVRVRVAASSTIHRSRRSVVNGEAVGFRGRLRGGWVPAQGKLVEVQFYARGKWRTFATTRTDRDGPLALHLSLRRHPRHRALALPRSDPARSGLPLHHRPITPRARYRPRPMTPSGGTSVSTNDPTPDPRKARRVRVVPSPAMAVALVALFVALGGTGYAVTRLPSNSVGTTQLRKNAVTSSRIRPRTIRLSDISTTTRTSLRGTQGPQGPTGPQGPGRAGHEHLPRRDRLWRRAACAAMPSQPAGAAERAPTPSSSVATCPAAKRPRRSPPYPAAAVVDPPAGRITVRPNGIRVEVHTYDVDGSVRDLPFNVIVAC